MTSLQELAFVAAHDEPTLRVIKRRRFPLISPTPDDDEDDVPTQKETSDERPIVSVADVDLAAWSPALGEDHAAPVQPKTAEAARVRLIKDKGAPVPLMQTYQEVADACLEGTAMAARHRALLRWDERAEEERRILELIDALVVTPRFSLLLMAWWQEAVDLPDPWKVWSPTFVLACLDGNDVVEALRTVWRSLSDGDVAAAIVAGEALAVGANPAWPTWARRLASDAHPMVRAVALEALSLGGHDIGDPDDLVARLSHEVDPTVRLILLRAAARAPDGLAIDQQLLAEWDRAVGAEPMWQAARALALRGNQDAYWAMKRDPGVASRLGAYALDLLALLGDEHDAPLARQIATRLGLTSSVMRGLGRYGHPAAAPALMRALGDEDSADDASEALIWLFGVPVGEEQVTSQKAWRAWIETASVDESARYRFGRIYTPACIGDTVTEGARSRADIEWLVDEANVRAGLMERPRLWRWSPRADEDLKPVLRRIAKLGSTEASSLQAKASSWHAASRTPGRRV